MLYKCRFNQTYNWTKNVRANTLSELQRIAALEFESIEKCDFLVFVYPGGKGANIEFGIANGLKKNIYIFDMLNEIDDPAYTSTFYHMPNVTKISGSKTKFIELILKTEV